MTDQNEYPHEQMSDLYYEAHITVEPVFDTKLEQLQTIATSCKFRVADLLMQKRQEDTPERSKYDSFLTSRSKSFRQIKQNTDHCVSLLQNEGFQVFRHKIEDTLEDIRYT